MPIDPLIRKRIEEKKKRLDRVRPLPELAIRRLKKRFDILLSYNSNALEGNTLTEGETRMVIEDGITIGGKSLKEHFEAKNHKKAIDFIEKAVSQRREIDKEVVCKLSEIILDRTVEEEVGAYRKRRVHVEGASFVPARPTIIEEKMDEFFRWLKRTKLHAIEKSAIAHEKFTLIHPFIDGNGRIARLLSSIILMQAGYPPIIILKTERMKYISTLDKAHQLRYKPFVDFFARCVERSLTIYLDALSEAKDEEEYRPIAEVAKNSRYSPEYISLLARKGRIDVLKTGRNWMISERSLRDYISTKRKYVKR